MALNIGSYFSKKKALETYINDHGVNIVVITEANVTESRVDQIHLDCFTCTNHCCRTKENVKGGGGGGVLILIHHSIQCIKGYNNTVKEENEMEHCSTMVYPRCDYGLPLNIVGVYRPPDCKHPPYEMALETMLQDFREKIQPQL